MSNELAVACPQCKALVLPADQVEHDQWHESLTEVLVQLTELVDAHDANWARWAEASPE